MNFSINYMEKTNRLLKEAFQFKKYKAMPLILAILVGIFMLPLVLISAILAVAVYLPGYMFAIVSQPVESLHKLLNNEGKEVKHGTQALIYLLSWGFIFLAYTGLAFLSIVLTVLYSLFSIFTYLWTLGGFKFHLFASEEDISIEVDRKYNVFAPIVFIAVMAVLLLVIPVFSSLAFLIEYKPEITLELLKGLFTTKLHETDGIRFLFSVLYSAIIFAPFPKKKDN